MEDKTSLPENHTPFSERTAGRPNAPVIFVSYSHKDSEWIEKVRVHLGSLNEEHTILNWDDSNIEPGDHWTSAIEEAIRDAKVAILLVSADFLASEFIRNHELPLIFEAVRTRGLKIISVLVRPCRFWGNSELAQFQAINNPSTTLSGLSECEQDQLLVGLTEVVAKEIRNVSKDVNSRISIEAASLGQDIETFELLRSEPLIRSVSKPGFCAVSRELPTLGTHKPNHHHYEYTHPWIDTPARKRSADELFPRVRQIPFLGIFFVGCATVWCWLRDKWEWLSSVVLDYETLRQIATTFLLLASGAFPLAVVAHARRNRASKFYPHWLIVYFLCFGLVSIATGSILGFKYAHEVWADSSADGTLRRVKAEHGAAFAHLEAIWQGFSDSTKSNVGLCLGRLDRELAPDLRSELGGNVALFVDAKITQFRDQDRGIWLALCILAIVAGVLNVISSALLARLWF